MKLMSHLKPGNSGTGMLLSTASRPILIIIAGLLLSSCGGGGGGGGGGSSGSSSTPGGGSSPPPAQTPQPPSTAWTANTYAPSSGYADWCAEPRTGTDPVTGFSYRDRQGNPNHEKFWMRSWTNELYLWYDEVFDRNPSNHADKLEYFSLLKTPLNNPSGTVKDRFHFTEPTTSFQLQSQAGITGGYGMRVSIERPFPPRVTWIDFVEPGSPAHSAGFVRGQQITAIDGIDIVNSVDPSQLQQASLALFAPAESETHQFEVVFPGSGQSIVRSVTSAFVSTASVPYISPIPTSTGLVGYLLFNNHNATAEAELAEAFTELRDQGISDLVLDMRYNGGGYLAIAAQAAWMIAGESATDGRAFERIAFNDKAGNTNPVTGAILEPALFQSEAIGFSLEPGTPLPSLELRRVFILTGPDTCSASESIINGLNGIGIEVIQIGSTTCGKPYGFYPRDNCGTTYFSIQFRGENDLGFGDYYDGFSPANTQDFFPGVLLQGCSVADDRNDQLGDPEEDMFKAALQYRETGSCPAPQPGVQPESSFSGSYSGSGTVTRSSQPPLGEARPFAASNKLYSLPLGQNTR